MYEFNAMTADALLTYFSVALVVAAAVFFGVGIARSSKRQIRDSDSEADAQAYANAARAMGRADLICGAILLAVALIAEAISLARGGPAAGEPSGNVPGGVLLIVLATVVSIIACLAVRQTILVRMRRRLDAQAGTSRE